METEGSFELTGQPVWLTTSSRFNVRPFVPEGMGEQLGKTPDISSWPLRWLCLSLGVRMESKGRMLPEHV